MLRHTILIALALLIGLTPALAKPLRLMVETAKVITDPLSGQDGLQIDLTPAGQQAIAEFTTEHVGKMIDVTIDGKLINSPTIQSPILGGTIMLSGPYSASDLQLMANQLTAKTSIVEIDLAKKQR
jgi:preprotein translocase subunit SecD